jgi:hypothetical protein
VKSTRRAFFQQTLTVGPVSMLLLMESDRAFAQGGDECTLPQPPNAQRFVPNERIVKTRYSAAEIAGQPTELARLRDGFGKVRGLPANDVIGWSKQIAQHCLQCARSNAQNIHYDWQFLPWHRAYLYFLEQIMRKLTHDDLRLVYWNWEDPNRRNPPDIYLPPGQPLYWSDRGDLHGPNWPLSNAKVDVQPLLGIADFDTFGGTSRQRAPVPASFGGPHANVHNNFAPGSMTDLQYSPRDPVFYAHHSNIDRLWSSWVANNHRNPDFGDSKVYFYDAEKKWRFVLLNDLKDEARLGYRYSSLMKPAVPAPRLHTFSASRTGNALRWEEPAMAALTAAAEAPHFLILTNISVEQFPATAREFGVFADQPAVGTDAASDAGFLGIASRVLSGGHAHEGPITAALNVTGKTSTLAPAGQGQLKLWVAPLDESEKTLAAAIPLNAATVNLIE